LTENRIKRKIPIPGIDEVKLFGPRDKYLRMLEDSLEARIVPRGSELSVEVSEDRADALEKVIYEMIMMVTREQPITQKDVDTLLDVTASQEITVSGVASGSEADSVILYKKDGFIKPKSKGQVDFHAACIANDIVFAIGPAGTGKTFLAVAIAVAALRDKMVNRIVLTRPAVEAGERLGFLPGDFREKIDPYLRPLYDALHEMIPGDKLKRYLESGVIEIVPLAYMRGRTLNNAFVILDEAQNTSFNQMKMFLTRLGMNSRSIVTGDVTQIDLNDSESSGLVQIQDILDDIDGIKFCYLSDRDVVRHRLVREIIKAYDHYENKSNGSPD
jgi:phosphate starvation-inducible PhoH-like protein